MFHKTASKSSGEIKNVEIALQYFESRNHCWHLVTSLGYNLHIRGINSKPTSGADGGLHAEPPQPRGVAAAAAATEKHRGTEHMAAPFLREQSSETEGNGNLRVWGY